VPLRVSDAISKVYFGEENVKGLSLRSSAFSRSNALVFHRKLLRYSIDTGTITTYTPFDDSDHPG